MRVVIVGGGFCGSFVAKKFDGKSGYDVLLIDKKEYFEYSPGLIRTIGDPEYHEKITVPFNEMLKESKFVKAEVESITPKEVRTDSSTFRYDYLAICSGISYPVYLERKENVHTISSGREIKRLNQDLKTGDHVLIVGGGLIGTEAAAELATKYDDLDITVVHSHERLIERNPKLPSSLAEKFLRKKGVDIIFGERVVDREGDRFLTNKNREIKADAAVWAAGIEWDTQFMQDFRADIRGENGSLKVNDRLQLEGDGRTYDHIFAGGDITDIDEEKTAHNALRHALLICKNIERSRKNKPLKMYTIQKNLILLSLGRKNSVLIYPPHGFQGRLPALIEWVVERAGITFFQM